MPKRLLDCVRDVKAKGGPSAKYTWPICIKSTGLQKHKRKIKLKSKKQKGGR